MPRVMFRRVFTIFRLSLSPLNASRLQPLRSVNGQGRGLLPLAAGEVGENGRLAPVRDGFNGKGHNGGPRGGIANSLRSREFVPDGFQEVVEHQVFGPLMSDAFGGFRSQGLP